MGTIFTDLLFVYPVSTLSLEDVFQTLGDFLDILKTIRTEYGPVFQCPFKS